MNIFKYLSKTSLFFVSGVLLNLFSINGQIPEGYYNNASGLANGELKTALSEIIRVGKRLGYGGGEGSTWSGFAKTDLHPEGYVWDMYSYQKRYFNADNKAPGGMNIEHSVAKSWWGGDSNNAYKDLYHLNPSDANANSARSNYPLGVVKDGKTVGSLKIGNNSFGNEYSGNSFEPLDEYKGDFARAYMYMFTCYEDLKWTGTQAPTMLNNEKYPMLKPWAAELLLKWNREDPVSEKELNRAADIYKIQENRNPFIDYPELAEYLWGENKGEPFFFTGIAYPVIITPANNTQFNFESIHYESVSMLEVTIKGRNLKSGLQFTLSGADAALFELSKSFISQEEAEAGTTLMITFHPVKAGDASATLTITGDEVKERNVFLNAVATEEFDVLTPENITSTSFDAVWTSSSQTNRFHLEVYNKVEVFHENVLIEDITFLSDLGGWKSSNDIYRDDSEKKGIRIGTSSKAGDISSPKLDLEVGGKLIFSAKKWAKDSDVAVTIKQNGVEIGKIKLTDTYEVYEQRLKTEVGESVISFHAQANKRLFLATAQIYSGGNATEEIALSGFPKWIENTNRLQISGLESDSTYYYRVTPDIVGASASKEMVARTKVFTSINNIETSDIKVFAIGDQIHIETIGNRAEVKIFNIDGQQIKATLLNGQTKKIKIENKGIYFIQVRTGNLVKYQKLLIQ